MESVTDRPCQAKCQGIGSYLKLVIKEKPKRSQFNPYAQVSLESIKVVAHFRQIWGRLTGYETKIKNKFIPLSKDKTRMNKLLLEMGVSAEVLNWYEDSDVDYKNLPVDEQTKITLSDMNDLRETFLEKEDFQAMKRITIDLKKVVSIGRKIFSLQSELEFVIAKQNYERAIELKEEIKKWEKDRDNYDALYETSRYERMIAMKRPNTADFNSQLMNNESKFDDDERNREMDDVIRDERSRLGKSVSGG